MLLSRHFFILFTIFLSISSFAQKKDSFTKKGDFSIGEIIELPSNILNEKRTLNIYLPHNYDKNKSKTYPVIYLLDGSADEDFIHVAGAVQFLSFSWINILPETIVVGIGNVDRKRDFTYPSGNEIDQRELPTQGHSGKFIQFIEKELQPFINQRYRTASVKTLIGQSLGGLLATEILFKHSHLFDNYLIVSPSLWWDDEKLQKSTPISHKSHKNVYIAVGTEGKVMERVAKDLYKHLKSDARDNVTLHFEFLKNKTHGDTLHQAVYNALELIFGSEKKK
ncbi:alpha/beta hydrolase [Tenacibaculum xiamenense]|uniref:alpha/beta hydrolase n=1 Tax=Tenacibaculum xiamenense TaxID=1261553 RepID=UPI0038B56652